MQGSRRVDATAVGGRATMTRRWRFWLQGGSLVLVAVLVAALVVVVTRRSAPPSLAGQPLQVGLQAPAVATVGASVPVAVSAAGADALTRFELWASNDLVAAQELASAGAAELITLPWLVEVAGTTTLVARAFDSAGRVVCRTPCPWPCGRAWSSNSSTTKPRARPSPSWLEPALTSRSW